MHRTVSRVSKRGPGRVHRRRRWWLRDLPASCLVVELAGMDVRTPDALALLESAIEVKRSRGLPSAMLKGYEWQRWLEVNGPGTWPCRPRRYASPR
ncbi:hypothetical protein [Kibdelosporangium philippinense]|uniref:hypothetical protein n=1 Tax=Kibdelosporangium philippinense TaxID=211113 RepID=UPI00360CB816